MYTKTILFGGLLGGVAFSAPATTERTNAEKRDSAKCYAHIYIEASNAAALPQHATWKWDVDVTTGSSGLVGHWDGTNPANAFVKVPSGKGLDLWISGYPSRKKDGAEGQKDDLTLEYNSRQWKSDQCKFIRKEAAPSNGWRWQFDWWCDYEC